VLECKDAINIHYIPPPRRFLTTKNKALFVFFGPLKVLFQILSLFYILQSVPQPLYILIQVYFLFSFVLIQNPPSIPTIVVARLVCSFRSAKLIIDWHNLGHTILALRLSQSHPLVRMHQLYEAVFSRFAYAHFSVTDALRRYLITTYRLQNVIVLRDRAPDRYSPIDNPRQTKVLAKLPETRDVDRNTTKILVTSTSYTADEPLHPLLTALIKYTSTQHVTLPNILLLITGRGPMQEEYRQMISNSCLSEPNAKCSVKMVWLEPHDYPLLLACADLGISLHESSSGMDFPMKIVDLFGCGVPVCAVRFPAYVILDRG